MQVNTELRLELIHFSMYFTLIGENAESGEDG